MKRQFALLFALTFIVSGMASIAEETAAENAQTEIVEETAMEETWWTAPFEDGEWLSVPEWNAEVYLPAGWMLAEVTETGFITSDAEGVETMTAAIEDFISEEETDGETEEDAEAETSESAEETAESTEETAESTEETAEETDAVVDGMELTAFENELMELGEEYELVLAGEREMAVFAAEDGVGVKFVVNDQLVTLTFTSAVEGGVTDSALAIAQTFYVYDVEEAEVVVEETETSEAAEETDAE